MFTQSPPRFIVPVLLLVALLLPTIAFAQTENPTPSPPIVHIVEEGENLTYIANLYNMTVEELQQRNNLSNEDIVYVGQTLLIVDGEDSGSAIAPTTLIPLVHTVEAGETLTYIAGLYATTIDGLLLINGLTDQNVYVGQTLLIPGGEGEAVPIIYTAALGDTLTSIAIAYNTTIADLMSDNGLIDPYYAPFPGQSLAVVSRTGSATPQPITGSPHLAAPGESLTMIAARYGVAPAELAAANDLPYPQTYLFAGQRLRIPGDAPYHFLPGEWVDVELRPFPVQQGKTVSIYVENLLDGAPSGQFAGQTLHFTPYGDGYTALIGLDAFTEPGLHQLELNGSGSQPWRPMQQAIPIESADYGTQYITIPDELNYLLAPEIRQNEDIFLDSLYTQFSPEQKWDGLFQMPVSNTVVTAEYGDYRSYNGGPIEIFHTGVDFSGGVGTPILAAANGEIVFAALLELRGNTVVVDHGLGVTTAYFHLSAISVAAGDEVVMGQEIGLGGGTGLSTGPHLHWDLRVMGQAVDGRQWVTVPFPGYPLGNSD